MSDQEIYTVVIIRRDGMGQTSDDYHATVKRCSDEEGLIFISSWKWVLKLRTCRWLLEREFKHHDKRKKKLEKKEIFTR